MFPETDDPELTALAGALAALTPSASKIDRDELLFRAGQASAPRCRWLWPGTTALLTALSVTLGVAMYFRPVSQVVVQVVYIPIEPASGQEAAAADKKPAPVDAGPFTLGQTEERTSPLSYLRLQQVVSAWGVDSLPDPHPMLSMRPSGRDDMGLDIVGRSDRLRKQAP